MYNQKRDFNRQGGGGRFDRRGAQPQRRPSRLPEGFSLYYLAVLCPDAINAKVKGFKDYMEQTYGSRAAAKSPAHLTIVPPFRAEEELESMLKDFAQTYSMGMMPVDVSLEGYGHFGDRVLFVDVAPNAGLQTLEKEAMQEFTQQFPSIIFGMKPDFNPHVTIATRDIPEGRLTEALEHFKQNHPFSENFTAKELKLLKLVNGWWEIL